MSIAESALQPRGDFVDGEVDHPCSILDVELHEGAVLRQDLGDGQRVEHLERRALELGERGPGKLDRMAPGSGARLRA